MAGNSICGEPTKRTTAMTPAAPIPLSPSPLAPTVKVAKSEEDGLSRLFAGLIKVSHFCVNSIR